MSILVQVSTLIERSRTDCALPAFDANTLITSAMVLDYIQRSALKLSALVQSNGADQQYFTLNTTLATIAGSPVVSLPTNTIDVVRIALVYDANNEVELRPAQLGQWDPSPGYLSALDDSIPVYSVQGNTITLYPTPTSIRNLRVYYTVSLSVTATTDYLALRPYWDEYITASANILIRKRQEKDAADMREARDEAAGEIVASLRRDRAGPQQIRDVRDTWLGGACRGARRWCT